MVWMSLALVGVLAVTLLLIRGGSPKGKSSKGKSSKGKPSKGKSSVGATKRRTATLSNTSKPMNSAKRSCSPGGSSPAGHTGAGTLAKGPYAAVAIKPGKNPCARVLERANVRYLESAIPTVPVLGCDSGNCQCGFKHFPDRRTDEDNDRRIGIGLRSELYGTSGQGERRQRRGRRMGDH